MVEKSGISRHTSLIVVFLSLLFAVSVCFGVPDGGDYISIDEIKPDMEAYCLTVFTGMEVERFELKLLSVVRGMSPGQDMILVIGTDDRFQHAGTVHGCSGSPVFIDGRLAGALAAGWDGGLDSLYLVRPIHDMLEVGAAGAVQSEPAGVAFHYDFSRPLDMADVYQQSMDQLQSWDLGQRMLLPLVSSLPGSLNESLGGAMQQMGFLPVSGSGMMPSAKDAGQFERGGVLAIPLCGGDISMAATGTVTEVAGDQVYGFGHQFTGRGPVSFPMSAGLVHTVVAGRGRSFKLATPGPVLGTLQSDQSSAVRGTIGLTPETIPFHLKVTRFNDPQVREYNCQLVVDRVYTPMIAMTVSMGAAQMQGPLPMEHTIQYRGQVQVKGHDPIVFENISSGTGTSDIERTMLTITSLLLNNPFEPMTIESIDLEMEIAPVSRRADIWAVDVSRSHVRGGQDVTASISLKSFRSSDTKTEIAFTVPDDLAAGTYKLQIMGDAEYQRFAAKTAPHRFRTFDVASLMQGLRRVTGFQQNRLHAVMAVPATGLVMRQHELADLPQTKMLLMQDAKRLQPVAVYKDWAESCRVLDKIVSGSAEIEITVER